jgi:hypothetical protein
MDARLLDPVDTSIRFTKNRAGFANGALPFNQGALQIRDHEVGLVKFVEQVVEETFGIALLEVGPIALDGADVRADEEGGHTKAESRK